MAAVAAKGVTDVKAQGRAVLQFRVSLEGRPKADVKPMAYLFDRAGRLLGKCPPEEGVVTFEVERHEVPGARLLIGPDWPDDDSRSEVLGPDTLLKHHAYEPSWTYDPDRFKKPYPLLEIPEIIWRWWPWCKCRVVGRVVKRVGATDRPVCGVRVHIWEVDCWPYLIIHWPDEIVLRVRDELIRVIKEPHWPWPPPPPPWDKFPHPPVPEPDPPPYAPVALDPTPVNIAEMNRQLLEAVGPEAGAAAALALLPRMDAVPEIMRKPTGGAEVTERRGEITLAPETEAALMSTSLPTVRQALIDHVALIHPWVCWWPWLWPWCCTKDEIAVVTTDSNGHFEKDIWYLCFGDHPDLYFTVECWLEGQWVTVYKPRVCCSTHWNYACGTEVTLRVTDPRVPWCGGPTLGPGKSLTVLTIGENVSVSQVTSGGLTPGGAPFGGRLEPRVDFGEGLVNGDYRYRWSYRRAGSSDSWHHMNRAVIRHYAVVAPSPLPPGWMITYIAHPLGPDPALPGQDLFQMQKAMPPPPGTHWAPGVSAHENLASAFFDTPVLGGGIASAGAGLYELKLELFKSAGSLVNFSDEGVSVFVPDPLVSAPFNAASPLTTVPAPASNLLMDGAKVVGFTMVVFVDNNPCTASIYEAKIGTAKAGDCGFIQYSDNPDVHLAFVAEHPNGFATFRFRTVRGSFGPIDVACAPVPSAASLPKVHDTSVNDFDRDAAGVFAKDVKVSDLVPPACAGNAAFAETLYVYAMATDGWGRLYYLDASATPMAFALSPT
jgi:hypothetical protein